MSCQWKISDFVTAWLALTSWQLCSQQPGTGAPWSTVLGQCTRCWRRWRRWWRDWPRSTRTPSPHPAAKLSSYSTALPRTPCIHFSETWKFLIWNNVSFHTQAAKYSLFTKVAGKWRVKIILRKKSLIIFHIFRQFNVWRRQEKYQDLWCRIHLTWSDGSVRVYRTWRANKIFWRKSLKDDVLQSGRINIDKSLQRMKDLHSY